MMLDKSNEPMKDVLLSEKDDSPVKALRTKEKMKSHEKDIQNQKSSKVENSLRTNDSTLDGNELEKAQPRSILCEENTSDDHDHTNKNQAAIGEKDISTMGNSKEAHIELPKITKLAPVEGENILNVDQNKKLTEADAAIEVKEEDKSLTKRNQDFVRNTKVQKKNKQDNNSTKDKKEELNETKAVPINDNISHEDILNANDTNKDTTIEKKKNSLADFHLNDKDHIKEKKFSLCYLVSVWPGSRCCLRRLGLVLRRLWLYASARSAPLGPL